LTVACLDSTLFHFSHATGTTSLQVSSNTLKVERAYYAKSAKSSKTALWHTKKQDVFDVGWAAGPQSGPHEVCVHGPADAAAAHLQDQEAGHHLPHQQLQPCRHGMLSSPHSGYRLNQTLKEARKRKERLRILALIQEQPENGDILEFQTLTACCMMTP